MADQRKTGSTRSKKMARDVPATATPVEDLAEIVADAAAANTQALVRINQPELGDADAPPAFGVRTTDIDHWGRSEKARRLAGNLYEPFYKYYFRVDLEGLEHIPTEGGALLVSNHSAAIPSDGPAIMHGIETELGRPVYGLAEYLFRRMPVIGTAWSRLGGVTAHPDNAYRLLREEGQLALVFPEGTKGTSKNFRDRYRVARFGRGGFIEVAMRAGAPIIPVAVVGAEESMPVLWQSKRLAKMMNLPYVPITANHLVFGPLLGTFMYFPAKFRIRFLPPVEFDVEPDLPRYSRSVLMEYSERVRRSIQDALYDMLSERKSVWFG